MRVLPVFLLIALLLPAVPARADFAAGMAAYEAGDYTVAYRIWRPLAEQGDSRAQYWFADLYRFGTGVDQDFGKAVTWYTKAAQQTKDGDTMRRAVYALGYMAEQGNGMAKDMAKAECLYRVSAMNGYANGQWAYYIVLREKPGIDFTALDWAERAAAQGLARALTRVGLLGTWSSLDDDAKSYMEIVVAANLGDEEAKEIIKKARTSDSPEIRAAFEEGNRRAQDWRPKIEEPPAPIVQVPDECWPN